MHAILHFINIWPRSMSTDQANFGVAAEISESRLFYRYEAITVSNATQLFVYNRCSAVLQYRPTPSQSVNSFVYANGTARAYDNRLKFYFFIFWLVL